MKLKNKLIIKYFNFRAFLIKKANAKKGNEFYREKILKDKMFQIVDNYFIKVIENVDKKYLKNKKKISKLKNKKKISKLNYEFHRKNKEIYNFEKIILKNIKTKKESGNHGK